MNSVIKISEVATWSNNDAVGALMKAIDEMKMPVRNAIRPILVSDVLARIFDDKNIPRDDIVMTSSEFMTIYRQELNVETIMPFEKIDPPIENLYSNVEPKHDGIEAARRRNRKFKQKGKAMRKR